MPNQHSGMATNALSGSPRILNLGTGWSAVVYFGLSLLYFLPAFLPGRHIFGTDYLAGGYFFFEFVSERLAAGEIPGWVPYIYGGLPLAANPGSTFYPVRLLADLLLPVTWILPTIFVFQFGVAGLGMNLLARELGCRRWVALVTGLAWQFTGITVSAVYAGHDGRVIVATFAPLLFFFLHRGIRTGAIAAFVGAAGTIGFSLLSFQIQSNYYLLLAGAIWAVFVLIHLGIHRESRRLARTVGFGLLAVAFGFTIAAVNFLPFIDYIPESPRGAQGGRGYEYSVSWSMPPAEIASLAVPEQAGILTAYQGENPFKLHTEYVGASVIVLLILGFRYARRNRYWLFMGGLAAFFLTIAFGGHTALYRLYYAVLPGTTMFRAPSISFFLVSMALVAMAGLTLERIAEEVDVGSADIGKWLIGIAGVAAFAAVLGAGGAAAVGYGRFALFTLLACGAMWLWNRGILATLGFVLVFGALTVVDLWIIDRNFFETVPPPAETFAQDDVAAFLARQEGTFRTWVLPFPAGGAYRGGGNYLMLYDQDQAGGEHGNQLHRFNEFAGAGAEVYVDWHNFLESANFLRAANIRFVVAMVELQTPFLREVHRGSAIIYENLLALPRAWVVGETREAGDVEQAIALLGSPDFDPERTVVVPEGITGLPASAPSLRASAEVVSEAPDRVEVRTTSDRPALLVLADNYYDGWRATVAGVDTPIIRANHTFRAVPVPAGDTEIVFEYAPSDLRLGFYIYLAAMIALFGYGAWWLVRGRQVSRPVGV